jgi:YVTN family beta-propeller protein
VVVPPVTGKTAQFDMMAIDQGAHRLFIADALDHGIDVVDVSKAQGQYLHTIVLPAVPNGIALVSERHRLYAASADSTVSVIDEDPASPRVDTVLTTVSTGGLGVADLLDYDSKDHKLYVTNPDDGFVSAIDVMTNAVVARIRNLGITGQPRYDPVDGMVYVLDGDRNSIIEIDPRNDGVVNEFVLPVICVPHGIAIDPATNQGLIGCGDKDNLVTISWDFGARRALHIFDLAGGGDQVIFDAKAQHFYFAASGYIPSEIAVFNASPITFLTAIPSSHHSIQVAYDETHSLIYTVDGLHLQAALWAFPDPVAGCFGTEAMLASEGAPRAETPDCHPERFAVAGS